MTYVDPIASMRKRDWALVIACCCVWLSHWIEIGNAGDASALGVVQVPFRITASCFTFLRCAWVATLVCLLLSCLFNGNQTKKLSWLAKVSWVLSAATLFIKYEDFSRSTFLDGVDMLPLLALAVVGWVQGVLISIFIDFARCIRSKRYAFEKGLPRIPDQVMRGMKGTLLLFCLLVLLGILIMVFWCRSSLLTQLCVVTGMVFLGTLSQFMSVSGKCRLELDNQKRILFDMVDRRIQMKRQSVPYKDSPLLRKEFERPSELQTFLSKGMQSHFNYEIEWKKGSTDGIGIFNGDIGVIESIDLNESRMRIRFDDRLANYDFELLDELELAYAITVHKSQGSEYPVVIVPMYSCPPMLMTRNLLYTAVTRAKKMVVMVGRAEVVMKMVENNSEILRYTTLKERLMDYGNN